MLPNQLTPTLPKGLTTLDMLRRNQNTSRRLNDEESLTILNATITVITLQEFLCHLENTSMYKQDLKKNCKALYKSLDGISLVAGAELLENEDCEESIVELIQNKVAFTNRLNKLHPQQWQIANYILRWVQTPDSYFFRAITQLCLEQDAQDAKNKTLQ